MPTHPIVTAEAPTIEHAEVFLSRMGISGGDDIPRNPPDDWSLGVCCLKLKVPKRDAEL